MSGSRSARAAHLFAEVEGLNLLKRRLEALRRERSAADEALHLAQQHASFLAAQQTQLEKRLRTMKASVRSARAMYVRQFLSTCPEDVLRCVFEAVVNRPDTLWTNFGRGEFNFQRAEAPFALAAVCARWRRVALECPIIWTYVGFPGPDFAQAHLRCITTILARSSRCGIDVIADCDWENYEPAASNDPFEIFISMIATHAHRWRAIELWLPISLKAGSLFTALRGPLPLLDRLSLSGSIQPPAVAVEKGDGFLPYAPNLAWLEIAIQGFEVADVFHPGFPSLRFLRTWSCCVNDNASRLLRLGQDSLASVDIHSTENVASPPPPFTNESTFPNLKSLCLRDDAFYIDWPQPGSIFTRLRKLSLHSEAAYIDVGRFLTGVAAQIVHLELFGDITIDVIDIAQEAANITHLTLAGPGNLDECHICIDIFAHIADEEPCIWPKLTSIRVAAATTLEPGTLDGVLRLINKRNSPPSCGADHDPAAELPARISEVVIEGKNNLTWLKAEIDRLLA